MDTLDILGQLKALADENRLKLVHLLLTQDLCVGALAHRIGITEAAVSQHLQVLRKAGLIRGEKRGYWTHYAVERKVLMDLAERLKAIAGQPSSTETCCRRKASDEVVCCRKEGKEDV